MARTPKHIDWKIVDEMIMMGEKEKVICDFLEMTDDNFLIRLKKEHPDYSDFSEYSRSKRAEGLNKLRKNTFSRALEGNQYCIQHLNKHMRGEWDTMPEKETPHDMAAEIEKKLIEVQYSNLKKEEEIRQLKEKIEQLQRQTNN